MLVEIMDSNLSLNLSGHLLEIKDDKFGRFEWREADPDVDNAEVAIALSRRFAVAFYEVSIPWRLTLECSLTKQLVHESTHVEANLRPERLVIGLENHPLKSPVKTFLHEQGEAADGNG